ncbi:MAG: VCBS repeat-containing protein, partial [Planctomycetes bacterium]|nr:VCBS repeat-containing protein [Planctomycetota bacterium]
MSDRGPKDARHTEHAPGLMARCQWLRVPAIVVVGLAIVTATYFAWRHFFPAFDPEAREMVRATWRVTSPHERPVVDDDARGAISVVQVGDVDRVETEVDRQMAKLDPAHDGWESEILSQQVSRQLVVIRQALSGGGEDLRDGVARIVSDGFSCAELRPTPLKLVFHGPQFVVQRYDATVERGDAGPKGTHAGAAGLAAALRGLVGPDVAGDVRAALKVIGITAEDGEITTTVLVEIAVPGKKSIRQINSRWICRWTLPDPPRTDRPLLRSIRVEQFEEVTLVDSRRALFADCTQAALGSLPCYGRQYLHGNNYWSQRISVLEASSILGNYGLAVGDVNGDGLEDLYVCDGGGLPNRLLLQNEDGTLRDVSAEAGVDWLEYSTGALLLDLDNDGDQDLVVATVELVLFMENDGSGKFTFRGGHRAVVDS